MKHAVRHLLTIGLAASALSLVACATEVDTDTTEAALSNTEHTAFNYFVSKGLTKVQAAGIVGNLVQESSVDPNAIQYGGGPGRGIAQWSVGGRWDSSYHDNVAWYAGQHGLSRWSLTAQLDFIWFELTNYGYGYAQLRAATTVNEAVIAFQDRYEICGECDETNRINAAKQALAAYGGGSSGGSSGPTCYSQTLGKQMPHNACVQSKFDDLWYQCASDGWVDRWTDPNPCNGIHPL